MKSLDRKGGKSVWIQFSSFAWTGVQYLPCTLSSDTAALIPFGQRHLFVIRSELGSRRCYNAFQTSRHAVKFLTVLRSLVWIFRLEKYTRLDVARYGVGATFSATACWACKYPCLNVESPPLFGLAGFLFSFVSVIPSLFTREWRFARC